MKPNREKPSESSLIIISDMSFGITETSEHMFITGIPYSQRCKTQTHTHNPHWFNYSKGTIHSGHPIGIWTECLGWLSWLKGDSISLGLWARLCLHRRQRGLLKIRHRVRRESSGFKRLRASKTAVATAKIRHENIFRECGPRPIVHGSAWERGTEQPGRRGLCTRFAPQFVRQPRSTTCAGPCLSSHSGLALTRFFHLTHPCEATGPGTCYSLAAFSSTHSSERKHNLDPFSN